MFYKTVIEKQEVDIPQSDLGRDLLNYVLEFRKGKKDIIPALFFLIKNEETHATFYSVSFGIQEGGEGEDDYYDVFLGSYVLDYSTAYNRLIEIQDEHDANFSFSDALYSKLENKPCYTIDSLKEKGFILFYNNGFAAREHTKYQEYVEQI